jgi:flagellar L-ring protein FlgH
MKTLLSLLLMPVSIWAQVVPSPGSLFVASGRLADSVRDVRAGVVDDIVTIVVSESLSAVSTGATQTSRKTSAQSQITAALGTLAATSKFANPLNISGNQQLAGTGQTSRTSTLTTTISARVIEVTENGNLIIEATKEIGVNSEKQQITIHGMVRPADLTTQNMVASNQVADLKIKVNGKGVVGDAVRRPNFLYRLILGLLPF